MNLKITRSKRVKKPKIQKNLINLGTLTYHYWQHLVVEFYCVKL
jgi:hypothetical protein